jgi:hypothetical protein
MRHLGLFAFGLTTAVLVPTALQVVGAGPKQVAKLTAPDAKSLEIAGRKIDVSVDKGIVDPGSKVKVTLAAAAGKKTTVDVLVYESQGSGGGRVELPPARVGYEEVTFDAKETSKSLSIALPGKRGEEMGGTRAWFGHYTILVLPQGAANKLEKLRHATAGEGDPMTDKTGNYNRWQEAYYSLTEGDAASDEDKAIAQPTEIARLDINTRPQSDVLTMKVGNTGTVNKAFDVKVTIHNPTGKAIEQVKIDLSSQASELSNEYKGLASNDVNIETTDETEIALKPHQTKTLTYHVTALTPGTVGLLATSTCDGSDCYEKGVIGKISEAALDAVDIQPADATSNKVAVQ